jgi:hypothetical protein
MHFILKLKHCQVFLILSVASITSNFEWVGNDFFNLAINTFGLIVYFLWYFAVGLELTEHLPPRIELGGTMFIINAFVLTVSILILIIVFDSEFSRNGFFGFVWVVYLMYAVVQFMFFPARALKSVEQQADVGFDQYFGYFLLMLFWPIGIWWMQPKLNRIGRLHEEPLQK